MSLSLGYLLEFYPNCPISSKPSPYRLSSLCDIMFSTAMTRKILPGKVLEEAYGEGKAAGNTLLPPTMHRKKEAMVFNACPN